MNSKCLICGKEKRGNKLICKECRESNDIEKVCNDIILYRPFCEGEKNNPLWDEMSKSLLPSEQFRKFAFELADELPAPRKNYQKIHSLSGEAMRLSKQDKSLFCELYVKINKNDLSIWEINRLDGLMLETLYMDYKYDEASKVAFDLDMNEPEDLPWQASAVLADFYMKTRCYDDCEKVLEAAERVNQGNDWLLSYLDRLKQDCKKYRDAKENGKKEYIPNPTVNKEAARESYFNYLESIGIHVAASQKSKKMPTKIPKEDCPPPVVISSTDFNSFVAFDLETTGFSPTTDSIIEIGAIKVINGEIVDSKEFIFTEFVKPYKKSVSPRITEVTGITKDDVKDARQMWEVIPDFMDFVGDNVLLGYNSARFDSKFLARAGRYSGLVIDNPHFDVLKYLKEIRGKIGYDEENEKLGTVARFCEVENPAAHRAWADAITTAKVYLKLKEMNER